MVIPPHNSSALRAQYAYDRGESGRGDARRLIRRKTDARRTPSYMRLPRVLSPQMHRRVDLVALPSVIASVLWMSRRDSRAAALMSMIAAGEGAALLTTDYPPGFLRWMSFRDHIWAATLHGILAASLALLVLGIPQRDRRVLLALASMPIVLSALSDTREQ
jgi:hypothetical protein